MSKREDAIAALVTILKTGLTGVDVKRDEPMPNNIDKVKRSLVSVFEGDPGEPEELLSPPSFIYNHRTEIEVYVRDGKAETRHSKMDALLSQIGTVLESSPTLGGAVDILTIGSPEFNDMSEAGMETVKAAVVPVYLEYVTTNPLT